jgi:hypothetical protein
MGVGDRGSAKIQENNDGYKKTIRVNENLMVTSNPIFVRIHFIARSSGEMFRRD